MSEEKMIKELMQSSYGAYIYLKDGSGISYKKSGRRAREEFYLVASDLANYGVTANESEVRRILEKHSR